MNLMVNDYCNLDCSYCFAKKQFSDDIRNISMEDFHYFINFLKKSNKPSLRLLGGEPTLHPNFVEMVQFANNDDFFKRITIFSNGLSLTKDIIDKIMSPKIEFLINFNHPKDIGEEKYNKICENVEYAVNSFRQRNLKIMLRLGLNIENENFEYQYILDKTKEYDLEGGIRYSLTVPTTNGVELKEEYYLKFIPRLMEFFNKCFEMNIRTSLDCNNIPKCLFSKQELVDLIYMGNDAIAKDGCCKPMDVNVDLQVTRCFPFFSKFAVNLKNFSDFDELDNYFNYHIDNYRFQIPTFKKCISCDFYKDKKCQGSCLTYKIK